jgi:iron complex outermembrane recepter protein
MSTDRDRSKTRRALFFACASSVGVTAMAQDQPADEPMQEITVTGTRIARPNYESTSPIVSISADAFELSGEVQIETVLNTLPQLVPSVTSTSNNPSNNGQANIDLRGLGNIGVTVGGGAPRTLVLLDGARLTPSNPTGVVDLNTVPTALIENVEVLTGGASSAYGSDAIAGVVNIKLKRNFQGVQLSAQSNVSERGDGRTTLIEALLGGNFAENRGNAVLAMSFDKRDEVLAGDREFGEVALGSTLAPVGSGTIPDGRVDWGANTPSAAAVNQVFAGYGASAGSVGTSTPIGFNSNGSLFALGATGAQFNVVNYLGNTDDPGFNPDTYSYNFGPVNYLQLPLDRKQLAGFARYEVAPAAELYTRLLYTTYEADQQLAATPVTCSGVPGCTVPASNPLIPADIRALMDSRADPTAPLSFTRRMNEVGARIQENSFDVVQGLAGIKGSFAAISRDFSWDIFASWGRVDATQRQMGNVSRSRLQAAYNNPTVYTAQGCAQFNPFGAGNITPECARAVGITATNTFESTQSDLVASISSSLFDVPAGSVRYAVGGEYRDTDAEFRPDQFLSSGDVVGFNAQQPVSGQIDVTEWFAELAVPLLKDKPLVRDLEADFGYRTSSYNMAGTYDTYKAALQWSPVETLKVRGSYNRAIRAPSISELFLPQQENFPQLTDPCNANSTFRKGPSAAQVVALCQAQGIPAGLIGGFNQLNSQARSIVGGNLNLKPEIADSYTFGVAWQSAVDNEWLRGLNVSVDYFNYKIDDLIASYTVSSVVGRCFNQLGSNPTFDPNNEFCQLFRRNPSNFSVTDVQTTSQNLSGVKQTGVDLDMDWNLPLAAFGADESAGRLNFRLLLTRLLSMEQQEVAIDPFIAREGTISQTVGSAFPEMKGVLATTYSFKSFQIRHNLRYIDSMDVVNADATFTRPVNGVRPHVPSYVYQDLTARWSINEMFGATLGVANLTDKEPPLYTTDSQAGIQSNTDPATYDVLGRRYFLSFSAKF